jgi:hypothetical protein
MGDMRNGSPGNGEPGKMENLKKLRNMYFVFLTSFFFLQLFGDSWISRVVAGALTVFSTAPFTRYPYL